MSSKKTQVDWIETCQKHVSHQREDVLLVQLAQRPQKVVQRMGGCRKKSRIQSYDFKIYNYNTSTVVDFAFLK
jgi:hypothetical protein